MQRHNLSAADVARLDQSKPGQAVAEDRVAHTLTLSL